MGWVLKIVAVVGMLLFLGCGRYQPEIGASPFLCAAADDTAGDPCPVTYTCVEGICRPHGWKPPDAGVDGDVDADADDASDDLGEQDGGG
jgi:hypothetical protein